MRKIYNYLIIILSIFMICGCNNKIEIQSNQIDDNVKQIQIIAKFINIREDKNIQAKPVGKVYSGEIYTVLEDDDTSIYKWIKIRTNNGIEGYITGYSDNVIFRNTNEELVDKIEETNNEIENETPNKEQQNKPETIRYIDANITYKCDEGYTVDKIKGKCYKTTSDESKIVLTCLNGFNLKDESCVAINKDDVIAKFEYKCEDGWKLEVIDNDRKCTKEDQISTPTKKYYCEKGWTEYKKIVDSEEKSYCKWDLNDIINKPSITCKDGYTYNKISETCELKKEEKAKVEYSCSSGYTLKINKCYK